MADQDFRIGNYRVVAWLALLSVFALALAAGALFSGVAFAQTQGDDGNVAPTFVDKPVRRAVDENAPAGSPVGLPVVADDQDGDELTYRFQRRRLSDKFEIDPATGQVTTRVPLDHEAVGRYETVVRVSDGKGGTDSVRLLVSVVNLEEPGELVVAPASPVVGVAQVATLSDPDVVSDGTASWEWHRSETNRAPWSAIVGASTNSYIPAEDDVGHYLRVQVSYDDGYADGNRLRQRLGAVASAAGGNRPPKFRWTTVTRQVSEDAELGSKVGAAVAADDPDGDTLTYAITDGAAGLFSVRKSTGQLKTAALLDFEGSPGAQHVLTLTADDGRGGVDSVLVTVHVGNVNEPGSVTFFPDPPRVGVGQKALLDDPDMVVRRSPAWTWERASAPGGPWHPMDPPVTVSRYTPSVGDAGLYLRATVSYDDGAGVGNVASQVSAPVLAELPEAPPGGASLSDAPTVRISGPQGQVTDFVKLDVVFSEPVTGLEVGDFVTNENVGEGHVHRLSGQDASYSVYVIPYRTGEVTVSLPADAVQDADGNGNVASDTYRFQAFLNRPKVEMYRYDPTPVAGPFEVYISFSESVEVWDRSAPRSELTYWAGRDGAPEDGDYMRSMERVKVENGVVSGFRKRHVGGPSGPDTQRHYVLSVVPAGNGPVTVELAEWAGVALEYKNGIPYARGSEPARRSFETDLYRPSVEISGPDGPVSGPFEVTISFTHEVNGFHADELVVTNGTAADRGEGERAEVLRVTITPSGPGRVSVALPTGAVSLYRTVFSGDPVVRVEELKGSFASNEYVVISN